MGEKSLEAVRTSDENKHNGSLNRSNTDSTARNEKPGTHLEGTPSNAYDLLHSNYTNNSLTVPGMRSDIKSSPSFVDIYRENAPTVKDLKKAASGYKLPYAMSIQSNGLNMAPNGALMTGNHNTVGKGERHLQACETMRVVVDFRMILVEDTHAASVQHLLEGRKSMVRFLIRLRSTGKWT